eukprot:693190-Prymnesium_polylepis.1
MPGWGRSPRRLPRHVASNAWASEGNLSDLSSRRRSCAASCWRWCSYQLPMPTSSAPQHNVLAVAEGAPALPQRPRRQLLASPTAWSPPSPPTAQCRRRR